MLWKVYFFIVVVVQGFAIFDVGFGRVWEMVDFPISLLSYAGLFAFCWKKSILKPVFWQAFLFVLLAWNLFYLFVIPLPPKYADQFPQTIVAIITLAFYVPTLIAIYLYAFRRPMENVVLVQKKQVPAGIKAIIFIFVLLFIVPLFFQGLSAGMKHLKAEEKVKLLQTEQYKKLNLKTVEDFDRYYAEHQINLDVYRIPLAVNALIILVLAVGLWRLENWGRLGMITLSAFKLGERVLGFPIKGATLPQMVTALIFLAFFIWILIYLTRPKIKAAF